MTWTASQVAQQVAQLPKVELHCHVTGTLRPATLAALAGKYGLQLPRPVDQLYTYRDFYDFLEVLRLVALVLREQDDFERVAYEAIEDAYKTSNVRHIEMSFNPQYFIPSGAGYAAQVAGLVAGIEAAERDFPVSALLLASFDREWDAASAEETMDLILSHRHERVVGIGLDGPERAGPPAKFEAVYRRATQAGLKKTAHVCEDNQTLAEAPPSHLDACLDLLRCDRLDHGYNLMASDAAIARARDSGVYFAVCGITSVAANRERRLDAIGRMAAAGLNTTLNTDDPAMFHTDMAHTYQHVLDGLGWGWQEARQFSLSGVEACWLDPQAKADLRRDFQAQIVELEAQPA
ncbi:adenosine deaminase [Variovorax sp. KK3]|uniref:adenosine deaminase n=1 Tax=Variovorax sp. KK3 TaxID=1855728 RepID=UPI00097C2DFA|nr:adenosine deaminase [Variovorax sp. KK3]